MYIDKIKEIEPHIDMIIKQAQKYNNHERYNHNNLFNNDNRYNRRQDFRDIELTKEIYDKLVLQILLYELNDDDLILTYSLMVFSKRRYYDVKAKPEEKEKIFKDMFENELKYSLQSKPNRNKIVNYMIKQPTLPQNLKEGLELINL